METRTSTELRTDSGVVHGVALNYDDITDRAPHGRREQFIRRAFQPFGAAMLNIEHRRTDAPLAWTNGGGLELIDGDELRIRAELQGDAGRATYDDIAAGKYKGLSIEFAALKERIDPLRNLRTISRALLHGVALTEAPAYKATSVEARSLRIEKRQGGLMLAGTLPHGPNSRIVTADSGRVRKAEYGRSTWEYSVNNRLGKLSELTMTLNRDISQQIASRTLGTLRLRNGKSGLHFQADLAARGENQLHDQLRESIEAKTTDWQIYPVIQIPPSLRVPRPFIDIPEEGNESVFIRKFLDVSLRQLSLVPKSGSPASKVRLSE